MKAKKDIKTPKYEAMSHSQKIKHQKEKLKRKKRQRDRFIFAVVILFVCAVGIALSFTIFFKIENIEVEGNGKYIKEQIIEESQITLSENMFVLNLKKTANKIEKALPYIGKAEIKRVLPDKILINITETEATYAIKEGKTYSLIDENTKVLEKGVAKPKSSLIYLVGIDTSEISEGCFLKDYEPETESTKKSNAKDKEVISTNADGETIEETTVPKEPEMSEIIEVLKSLSEGVEAAEIKGVNSYDVSDLNDIKIVYQNRFTLLLGNTNNIERKLRLAKKAIEEEDTKRPNRTGIIDLRVDSKASVRQEEYATKAVTTEEETEITTEKTAEPSQNNEDN